MYTEHRLRFLKRLSEERACALVFASPTRVRNHDCDHRYRPDSDFWYLTGFGEQDACLVLLPGEEGSQHKSILFLRERDPLMETWNGRRLGIERAPEVLGVDEAYDIKDLWTELPKILSDWEIGRAS